jgi:hypothetical protein
MDYDNSFKTFSVADNASKNCWKQYDENDEKRLMYLVNKFVIQIVTKVEFLIYYLRYAFYNLHL